MKKATLRWGCVFGGILILLLLMVAAGFYFLRAKPASHEQQPPSPVLVFILSPSDGAEIEAGGFLQVTAQANAPEPIQRVELFVDGSPLGAAESADNPAWTWQAFPAGIHTLFARAAMASGEIGQSQTVIVNVLSGDGLMQVTAAGGQTLEQVGSGFGVPPDQMAAANPLLDPALPLDDGQPVQVPAGGGDSGGQGPGNGPGGNGQDLQPIPAEVIEWQFEPSDPVDHSYCYTSTGGDIWEKMPHDPFEFFGGGKVSYLQPGLHFDQDQVVLKAQCWGWLGGALKFLGEGQTQFSPQAPAQQVAIVADGFQLTGLPQLPPVPTTGLPKILVPPPYAVREPLDAGDCAAHSNPLLAPFICDKLMNAPLKQFVLVEWEWQPKFCWGACDWVTEIDGYEVSELDPVSKAVKNTKQISNAGQKVTAFPLPWGASCYGVRAYVQNPSYAHSTMTIYCNSDPPQPQVTTLIPIAWLTTGGQWVDDGDCDTYGGADAYLVNNQDTGFGNGTGEIFVGSYIVDDEDADCYREGNYGGAVKFIQPVLPPGAFIQKAVLRFSQVFTEYKASGVATNYTLFCVGGVGKAVQDWSGLITENHFSGSNVLPGPAYNSPLSALSGWSTAPQVDVTSVVKGWISHPETNHGLIFTPAPALSPATDGSGSCLSGAGNFAVDVYYFAP